jgi:gamma-glutamyltranspeptidase/glutathione hydrolase
VIRGTLSYALLCSTLLVHHLQAAPPRPTVVAAHPLAADAGHTAFDAGGNAIDAAIATAFALTVVEPQASGIGGGGFAVGWDAANSEIWSLDFRERAPLSLTDEQVFAAERTAEAVLRDSGSSIATPGLVKGLLRLHSERGSLPLDVLLAPAIRHAEEGIAVTPLHVKYLNDYADKVAANDESAAIYLEDGVFPREVGATLIQTDAAATLRSITAGGVNAIYTGATAERMVVASRDHGGWLSLQDLADYRPLPLRLARQRIDGLEYVMPMAPSAAGAKVLGALSALEEHPVDPAHVEPWGGLLRPYIIASLSIIATIDAELGDPRFVPDPSDRVLASAGALAPPATAPDTAPKLVPSVDVGKTTHLSVVDSDGNAVALTQTINYFFGSGITVPGTGIMLNNEMADFTPTAGHPNAPAPGKTPRSNMVPAIVLRDGRPAMVIGSPGGERIPLAVSQVLLHRYRRGLSLQEAINAPRIHIAPDRSRIVAEPDPNDPRWEPTLRKICTDLGLRLEMRPGLDSYFGGVHAIEISPEGETVGVADPRREGAVR